MRICGTGAVLIGPEGRTPPLPFITVSESEGNALIAQNLGVEVDGDAEGDAAEIAAREAAETAERERIANAEAAERERVARAEAEAAERERVADAEAEEARRIREAEANANSGGNAEGGEGGAEGETREEMLIAALDLMEAGDLVKNGERAGKPKVAAMEAATGLADIHADEIDAAIAAKEAAE